jgi:predicted ATP-binding protein involved in virulence
MIVNRLKIANLRAMEAAEFRFQPGFNLIVGVNGVGKTSVLDALGVCLSAVVKQVNKLRTRVEAFTPDDIRVGAEALTVECDITCRETDHTYLVHKPRETSTPQEKKAGMPREQVHDTPERNEFLGKAPALASGKEPGGRPLAVLFSTNRAVPSERAPGKGLAAGGVAAAFADAFVRRELRLGEFADWMRVQRSLRKEHPAADRVLSAFENTVTRFLPDYANLRLDGEDGRQLWIDRGKTAMPVRQLSDGERGTLALVLDLTRRLAQANPHLDDPAAKAEAVVLIDEIDLHLHPKWQRQIIHNLREAFPRCQFIATTHSPQVIGEVENDRVQIIANGLVYSPPHSYGVDSSRVLEEVMDSESRAKEVKELLSQISQTIGKQYYERARELLARLLERLGETDPEVTRLNILLDFVEGKE